MLQIWAEIYLIRRVMNKMRMWRNGEKAEIIQAIIEYNFKLLGKHLPHNMLSLPTTERELLSSDYLSKGLRIFDTDLNQWFEYNGSKWVEWEQEYVRDISMSDWDNGKITISYSTHLMRNPIVQLFILNNNSYSSVVGGVDIDDNWNVTLTTDLAFNGKVVIK